MTAAGLLRQPEQLVAVPQRAAARPGASPTARSWPGCGSASATPPTAAAGHEAVIVSHQLPIWMARCDAEGRRLFHDPRRGECRLASVTSLTLSSTAGSRRSATGSRPPSLYRPPSTHEVRRGLLVPQPRAVARPPRSSCSRRRGRGGAVWSSPACSTTGADEGTRSAGQEGYVGVREQPHPDRRRPSAAGCRRSPATSLDGKPLSTADYPGQVLVVNVWGSWCAPCRAEAPALQAASAATKAPRPVPRHHHPRQRPGRRPRPSSGPSASATRASSTPTARPCSPSPATLPPERHPVHADPRRQGRLAVRVLGEISERTLVDMIDDVRGRPLDSSARPGRPGPRAAVGGSMALAVPVALLAGLVSFFSPCVVPLLPGYLSYATGLGAAEVLGGTAAPRPDARRHLPVRAGHRRRLRGHRHGGRRPGRALLGHAEVITRVLGVRRHRPRADVRRRLRVGRRELRIPRLPDARRRRRPAAGRGLRPRLDARASARPSASSTAWPSPRPPRCAAACWPSSSRSASASPSSSPAWSTPGWPAPSGSCAATSWLLLRVGGLAMVVVGLLLVTGLWTDLTAALRRPSPPSSR